jgi:DNA-binding NarL/FixJ family response regulator
MIRVVVVDDQTLVRRGIVSLLSLTTDIVVVADAADGRAAIDTIARTAPDVVLLDVRMPAIDGFQVLRTLRDAEALPPTILLTTFDDDEVLLEGIRSGARGYLLKDVSLEELTDAIRAVARGETLLRAGVTDRARRSLDRLGNSFAALDPADPLTTREREVLRLMAGGYSNREIADALGTAEGTIKNHVSSVLSKLGVRDRTRAVLRGLERGYI